MRFLQFFLSCALLIAWWKSVILSSLNCCLMTLIRVVGGRPTGFLISLIASYNAILAGAPSGRCATWPKNLNLLNSIFFDHSVCFVSVYSSLLLNQFPLHHLIPSMLRSNCLWQMSILSQKILSLSFRLTFLLLKMFLSVLYAWFARLILLLMSSCVPSKLPTYLHFLQSLGPSLVILYFSVFPWFMKRFVLFKISGISASMFSRMCIPIDAHPMSSAYCWSTVKKLLLFISFA